MRIAIECYGVRLYVSDVSSADLLKALAQKEKIAKQINRNLREGVQLSGFRFRFTLAKRGYLVFAS